MSASVSEEIAIRDARAADSTAVAALLAQLGYPTAPANVVRRLERLAEDASNRVLVAEIGGSVVGAYLRPLIHQDAGFVRIACLIVEDQWRDRGVGRRLVDAVEGWARAQGCDVAEVTSGNQRLDAHRFYEGLGYAEKRKRFVKNI
jgi:N-acetylglutamate synthase-like GNAT family acetyltransferase